MKLGDRVKLIDPECAYPSNYGIIQNLDSAGALIRLDCGEYAHLDFEAFRLDEGPSGGASNSDYYIIRVDFPTDESWEPYSAQCNDLIESLDMTFAEGEAFKAIWRRCRARQGFGKKGNSQKYDAEKVEFFGRRMVVQSK